jgi:uncharacterized metal-binding protein YceD (DUF177 family)
MIIEVNKLIGKTLRVVKAIPLCSEWEPREGSIYCSPIAVDLTIEVRANNVIIQGSFLADLLSSCDRTLRRFVLPVNGKIELEFRSSNELNKKSEVELGEGDLNVSFHQGSINLVEVVNEAVLLEMPMKVLSPDATEEFSAKFGTSEEDRIDERFSVLMKVKERFQNPDKS